MFELFDLSIHYWMIFFACGILVGMSKTGVPGVSLIVIPLLALIFGGKNSTGILLPILIMADAFGVMYYHRHAEWKHVLRALPWAILGVLIATIVGQYIDDEQFKLLIAIVIFAGLFLMIWRDMKKSISVPDTWWFAAVMGLAGGFSTMIGNAAGPVMAIYLLALRLPKNSYIGTTAWFFAIINLLKVPFHIFSWKTISLQTVVFDLTALPFVMIGAFVGIRIIKQISTSHYRWFVMGATLLSAILMLL